MSSPYFFIKKENVADNSIVISGINYNHLVRVLRLRAGDAVEFSDNESKRYRASVAEIRKKEAVLVVKEIGNLTKSFPQTALFLCILKKDAMEYAIQKTVEIGIDEIVPVFSDRVVVELGRDKIKGKILRWQNIAESASKQCRRDFICRVKDAVKISCIEPSLSDIFFIPVERELFSREGISLAKLEDFLRNMGGRYGNKTGKNEADMNEADMKEAGPKESVKEKVWQEETWKEKAKKEEAENEEAEKNRRNKYTQRLQKEEYKYKNEHGILKNLRKISYIIGPEGGFENNEIAMLVKKGAVPVNFGKNILRSETASVYFLSVLDYIFKTSLSS